MVKAKQWLPGKADAVWKVIICAHEASQTDDVLNYLSYILTDAGGDKERGLETIRQMSGEQIIGGLLAYRDTSYQSVAMALPPVSPKETE